jgi:DnaJ-class molecular chaperone
VVLQGERAVDALVRLATATERIAAKLDRVVLEEDQRCPACRGTGRILSQPTGYVCACPTCAGSGLRPEVQP